MVIKKKKTSLIPFIISGFLFIGIVLLGIKINLLNFRINELENTQKVLKTNLTLFKDNYDFFKNDTNFRVYSLEQDFANTILSQKGEIEYLSNEFQNMTNKLDYYFEWFKQNSNLSETDLIKVSTVKDCASGIINLPCIGFRNERTYEIEYASDIEKGDVDFIQPISSTIFEKSGDCEDLATLFMAEVNYLKSSYGDFFRAWTATENGDVKVIGDWYMNKAREVEFNAPYVYVACYSMPDVGHCINAFCNKELVSELKKGEDPVDLLDSCYLIEPQIYGELYTIENINGTDWIGGTYNKAPFLDWLLFFSANDLCMNSETGWKCFSDFDAEAEELSKQFK